MGGGGSRSRLLNVLGDLFINRRRHAVEESDDSIEGMVARGNHMTQQLGTGQCIADCHWVGLSREIGK